MATAVHSFVEIESPNEERGILLPPEIAKLQDECDVYLKKLELERRRYMELEIQCKQMKLALNQEIKNKTVPLDEVQVQRKIKRLEDRIEISVRKCNEAKAENEKLKYDINALRQQRTAFLEVEKKLQKEHTEAQRKIMQFVEQSMDLFEARDDARVELDAIKKQEDIERAEFEKELSQLDEELAMIKAQLEEEGKKETAEVRSLASTVRLKNHAPGSRGSIGLGGLGLVSPVHDELRPSSRGSRPGSSSSSTQELAMKKRIEELQKYEEVFLRLQEATGIHDIDHLVSSFMEGEERNYSLYARTQQLTQEIESYQEAIAALKEDMRQYTSEHVSSAEKRDGNYFRATQQLQEFNSEIEVFESKYEESASRLDAILPNVRRLVEKTHSLSTGEFTSESMPSSLTAAAVAAASNWAKAVESAGESKENTALDTDMLSILNVVEFMGIVESRINYLLRQQDKKSKSRHSGRTTPNASHSSHGKEENTMKQSRSLPALPAKRQNGSSPSPGAVLGLGSNWPDIISTLEKPVQGIAHTNSPAIEINETEDDDGARPLSTSEIKRATQLTLQRYLQDGNQGKRKTGTNRHAGVSF